ncbi:MAG: carbohydrate kinase family protein [Candidatus Liptonbacteria bacterium]|nr:carbohydrate kinase family protein [Candidatus Liptonbacteria bacterium]
MKILVSGSIAYDRIMEYSGRFSDHIMPDKIHTLSLSFVADSFKEYFGGTAGDIAYGLALLGEKAEILAATGKDFQPYRERLEKIGVGFIFARNAPDQTTTMANIMTDHSDNQIAALCIGAMAYSCEVEEEKIPREALAIISPGNVEDMQKLPELYRRKKIPFIFDPGQQIAALNVDDLRNGINGAKILISNDYELALVLEKTGWTEKDILSRAEIIITTLGEKGSRIQTREKILEIPPAKVKAVVDPTGAGDAFRAGFIKGLIQNWPMEEAGQFAGVMAAYAVETYGTQEYQTTFPEALARYEENFGPAPQMR